MTRALRPMSRRIPALLAAAALLAASPLADAPAEAAVERTRILRCPGGGDCWPAAFQFTRNGKVVFFLERFSGRIRRFNRVTGRVTTFRRVGNLQTSGERGGLGLALHPRFPQRNWIYVFVSKPDGYNRILRYRKRDDGRVTGQRIFAYRSNTNHNGGAIGFGPDDRLYAVTGDLGSPAKSQRTRSKAGKVLRMTARGRRPSDNPFPRLAWSIGHRNSFGFAFDPQTDRLWQTENGPECEDELNRIRRGRNYGWGPGSNCPGTSTSGPNPVGPRWSFTPVPAVTGATFCDGCGLAGTEGDLVFGAWNDGRLRRAQLTGDRLGVSGVSTLFNHPRGVLDVETGAGGRIFFSDSRGIYRLNES